MEMQKLNVDFFVCTGQNLEHIFDDQQKIKVRKRELTDQWPNQWRQNERSKIVSFRSPMP
jgi:hypothetical protein